MQSELAPVVEVEQDRPMLGAMVWEPDREGAGRIRRGATHELGTALLDEIKSLLVHAFGTDFSPEDWAHALGGTHFWIEEEGRPVSHAAVVEREIVVADRALRTGYVEAVATDENAADTKPRPERRDHVRLAPSRRLVEATSHED